MQFHVKKTSDLAVVPKRSTAGAVGYDLHAVEDVIIYAGKKAMVDTGIAIAISEGCYGRVAPRSGLAAKHNMSVMAGVIDTDYRDSIRVILFNHGEVDFHVHVGDRIAQLVFEKVALPELVEGDLDDTERGTGGFGSTGV